MRNRSTGLGHINVTGQEDQDNDNTQWQVLLRQRGNRDTGGTRSYGLLPLLGLSLLVRSAGKCFHVMEAAECTRHQGRRVHRKIRQERGEPAPVLQALRRSSDDRPPDLRVG